MIISCEEKRRGLPLYGTRVVGFFEYIQIV
ncbi:uncharacterized protein METZ01_LOCUS251134 [marine metagenome]|uniref:Uncharacterized protein n=1 Tax=marine metagenome TaxID=408172 RepID=A0A382IF58_9ZZZZ